MKRKGFTLVEMLAVIGVLGILVLLVLPNVLKNYRDAKKIAFIDEAKAVYSASTDKFVTERTKGNKIGLIEKDGTNETQPLAISNNDDLNYTVRLDNNGQVTAFKLTNGELCIVGVGDFLGSYTKEDVLDLSEEEAQEKCAVTALNDDQKFILRLQNKTTVKTDYEPKMIYLKYNNGWYSDNNMHRKITNVTIPYKENNYYKGAWATNTIGSEIQAIACDGSIVPGPDGGGIFTGREEKPYVEAISRFEKKYYHVVFTGGESGSLTMEPCYYGASECHLPSNKDSNGYGKDIKKTGYLFTGWKDTKTNKIYADGASLPILTDANENEEAYKTYKFDNTKVCSNGEDEGDTNKINFEAQWTPIKYKIAYDCNEGTGTMANTDHTYDAEANLRTNTCKRSGYSFLGWSKTKTGSKDFDDNAKVKNLTTVHNSTVTLYAVWNACSAGTYLAGNTCTECAKDYYSAGTANASCTKCPTGYTTTGKGSSTKSACTINCAANKRVASVDAQCTTACATGYSHAAHTIKAGETSSVCTANTFTVAYDKNGGSGTIASHQCTYDQDCKLAANTFQRAGYIFAGWKKSNTGNTLAAGASIKNTVTSGTVTYYAQWTKCNAGTYSSLAMTTCDNCAAGTYSAAGASSCTNCAAGTYSGAKASSCTNCAAGTYSGAKASSCTNCPAGTYSGAKAATCTNCAAGTYSGAKATKCTNCAAGTYSGAKASTCTNCPAGTYSGAKASTCTNCAAGTYSGVKASSCTNCAAGTYSGAKASSCTNCPAGTYSGAKASTCTNCAAGTYSGAKASSCTNCPAGTYSGAKASTCTNCAAGTYSGAKASSCTNCPAGTYSGAKASSCTKCVVGSYSGAKATKCIACQGKTTTAAGSSSCNKNCDNAANVGSWKTTVWNTNNTVSNLCVINTCATNYELVSGVCKAKASFAFRYTGSFTYKEGNGGEVAANNTTVTLKNATWQVKFLSNGTLTVNAIGSNIDAFLVGGGGGAGGCGDTRGGGGGGGGFTTTKTNFALGITNYAITIGGGGGCGSWGGQSAAFGLTANGGGPGTGFWSGGSGGTGGSGGGGTFGGNAWPSPEGTGGSNGSSGQTGNTYTYSGIDRNSSGGTGCSSNGGCKINGSTCYNTSAFCENGNELYAGGGAGSDHEYCGVGGSGGGGGSGQSGWCVCGCPGGAQANKGGGGAAAGGSSGIVIIRNKR